MRLIKVKVKREKILGGGTHYVYPPQWNAERLNSGFGPLYESGEKYNDVVSRGDDHEYVLIGVQDADADSFLQADGYKDGSGFSFEAKEITKAKAIEDCDSWIVPREKMTDQSKVLSILARVARGEELTQAEKDSIDPSKPEVGITMTKNLTQMLDELTINPSETATRATTE